MIVIRCMAPEDISATASLLEEMQAHYSVPCPSHDDIVVKLENLHEGVNVLVAIAERVVGFAAVGIIFPGPGLLPGLFLKELFVSASMRGSGIGTELMRAVARLAVEQGLARVDWTANRDDARLLRFYDDIGAIEQKEKIFLRLSGRALDSLADISPGQISEANPD